MLPHLQEWESSLYLRLCPFLMFYMLFTQSSSLSSSLSVTNLDYSQSSPPASYFFLGTLSSTLSLRRRESKHSAADSECGAGSVPRYFHPQQVSDHCVCCTAGPVNTRLSQHYCVISARVVKCWTTLPTTFLRLKIGQKVTGKMIL